MASSDRTNLSDDAMECQEDIPAKYREIEAAERAMLQRSQSHNDAMECHEYITEKYREIKAVERAMSQRSQSQAAERIAKSTEEMASLERSIAAFGQ